MKTAFLKAFPAVYSPEGLHPMLVPNLSTKDVASIFPSNQPLE